MSFKYINPGIVFLVADSATATQLTNTEYSKTGLAFTQPKSYAVLTYANLINDLYITFDFYITTSESAGGYVTVKSSYNSTSYNIYGFKVSNSNCCCYYTSAEVGQKFSAKAQSLNTLWGHLHITESKETSYIEMKLNNNPLYRFNCVDSSKTHYSLYTEGITPIVLYEYWSVTNVKFSNIIISDEYIKPGEQIIKLPISETKSDMTFDKETGLYTATAANQSLLSAVNVNSLIEEYGADSQVTGLTLIGNPAYKTAEGLSSLTAISSDSSSAVTNYGTYALSDDTTAMIADGQILTNTTIADLRGKKFGWRAG